MTHKDIVMYASATNAVTVCMEAGICAGIVRSDKHDTTLFTHCCINDGSSGKCVQVAADNVSR